MIQIEVRSVVVDNFVFWILEPLRSVKNLIYYCFWSVFLFVIVGFILLGLFNIFSEESFAFYGSVGVYNDVRALVHWGTLVVILFLGEGRNNGGREGEFRVVFIEGWRTHAEGWETIILSLVGRTYGLIVPLVRVVEGHFLYFGAVPCQDASELERVWMLVLEVERTGGYWGGVRIVGELYTRGGRLHCCANFILFILEYN